jgi:transmembrane sensor
LETHLLKNLLEKHKKGKCSPAEIKLIEDWLETIKNDDAVYTNAFIARQLGITKSRIDRIISQQPCSQPQKSFTWLKMAASLLLFVLTGVAVFKSYQKKQAAEAFSNKPTVERHILNGWVCIQTQKGVTAHIKMPDGSLVTLDASSTLRYPVKFINHKRRVYLDEGEALFEVAKDKASPFTVYTTKFATTALGTAFNIRSYANEHKISISLIHGKIKVDDLRPSVSNSATKILLPHQQIVFNKTSGILLKTYFKDALPITAWKDGVLSFQDATTDEVINAIQNKFNVEIANNSTRTNWSYTGVFTDEPLNDVLKTVCLTEGIAYTINKNDITLH